MSTCFDIRTSVGSYSVQIQSGIAKQFLKEHAGGIVLADSWLAANSDLPIDRTLSIPAVETIKNLAAIPDLVVQLRKLGTNRQTNLIALGGGIVQDVAAFIASIYMRGIEWTYFPTTILSMADSCIGGKSSINVGQYKNLIGTFHPPVRILIDPDFAASLTNEQRINGLIEAAKICYCRGPIEFENYISLDPNPSTLIDRLEKIIVSSLLCKKWFIEIDEFDQRERLLLNFGHTFGHAIESASHYKIAHGVGVGLGILCAIQAGRNLGREYNNSPMVSVLATHLNELLAEVPLLNEQLQDICISEIIESFQSDKKHRDDSYSLILVAESGNVEHCRIPRDRNSLNIIELSIRQALGLS